MADLGFPAQHTTTTTVTSNTTVQTNLRYDPLYIRTKDGIIKIVQIVLSLLGFICVQCSVSATIIQGRYFSTVAMFGFWISGLLLLGYLFHVVEKFYKIPWIKFELFYCLILTLNYLIAACVSVVLGSSAFQAAAFFGFCAMVVYAIDAYFKFLAMKSGALAQGERHINKETTTATY